LGKGFTKAGKEGFQKEGDFKGLGSYEGIGRGETSTRGGEKISPPHQAIREGFSPKWSPELVALCAPNLRGGRKN